MNIPNFHHRALSNRLGKILHIPGAENQKHRVFQNGTSALCKKANRALFKLKGILSGTGLKPAIILDVFDKPVKPIALYGTEFWGIDSLKLQRR